MPARVSALVLPGTQTWPVRGRLRFPVREGECGGAGSPRGCDSPFSRDVRPVDFPCAASCCVSVPFGCSHRRLGHRGSVPGVPARCPAGTCPPSEHHPLSSLCRHPRDRTASALLCERTENTSWAGLAGLGGGPCPPRFSLENVSSELESLLAVRDRKFTSCFFSL